MASLYRKTVTRPLPKSATIEDRERGPVAVWRDRNGKRRAAPLVLDADGKPKLSAKGEPQIRTKTATMYLKVPGIGEDIPTGCRTEDGARYKLGELVKRAEHLKANILTEAEARTADHQTTPLGEHIDAFVEHLKAKGVTAAHRKTQAARLRALAEGCCFAKLRDLDRGALENWLVKQADADMSARTRNAYGAAAVSFANWCIDTHRLTANPFARLPKADERADPRRKRRAMTEVELARLLKVARLRPLAEYGRPTVKLANADKRENPKSRATWAKAPLTWETLDAAAASARESLGENNADLLTDLEHRGRERALLYKVLVLTGLRKGELASLTVGQCELVGATPHIALNAADEKNREGNTIPLRVDLAADLSRHLAGRLEIAQAAAKRDGGAIPLRLPPTEKLLYVPAALVRIMDRDLEAANIPKRDDRDRVLDVHALRHTFGSLLSKAGVPLRTAQAAMRHSDPSLTANVYTDPRLLDVSGAVESLPALPLDDAPDTEQQRTTAVAGGATSVALNFAPRDGNLGLCKAIAGKRSESRATARVQGGAAVSAALAKRNDPLTSVANGSRNGADEIRTHDLLHAMQALSQLSYGPRRLSVFSSQYPASEAPNATSRAVHHGIIRTTPPSHWSG